MRYALGMLLALAAVLIAHAAPPPPIPVPMPMPVPVPIPVPPAAGPEIAWQRERPGFIKQVYFAAAPSHGPLQSPPFPRPDLGPFYVPAGMPLWLVVETEGASAGRELCARWPDPGGEAAALDCQPLVRGPARLVFAGPETTSWPQGRYLVWLAIADTSAPRAASSPIARIVYALDHRDPRGQGAPPPRPIAMELPIPDFPWPPPRPTSRHVLDPALCTGGAATLGSVGARLEMALQRVGYSERSYYAAPGGFALATRLEQIEFDGTPKPEPLRWATQLPPRRVFSIADYLRALFQAPVGHYRVIVFVVNDRVFTTDPATISRDEARAWLDGGVNRLPPAIARQPFGEHHACTALVYQFKKLGHDDAPIANPDGAASADRQLARSGILRALEQ